jgi:hypothetical protein
MGITTAYNLTPFTGLVDPCNGVPGALRLPEPPHYGHSTSPHVETSTYPWRAEQDPGELTPGLVARACVSTGGACVPPGTSVALS